MSAERSTAEVLLRSAIFTVVAPGSVTIVGPMLLLQMAPPDPASPFRSPALALVVGAIGLGIYLWCVADFALAGRGTPAPIDAPTRLVVRGLYRRMRNPMYAGVLSILGAETIWLGSGALALYTLCVLGLFSTFILLYEEPTLRRVFGEEYARYCERVPRWIPRWPRA
jgi:protein-S-isoprenylcysteine O-methyltransferase Ste14